MEQFEDISFKRLAEMLWRHLGLIIAITLISGVISFLYSSIMMVPEYESSVTLYVKNGDSVNAGKTLGSDIQTAQMLVDTYIVILKSDTFLDEVNTRLANKGIVDYSVEKLRYSISANAVDATEIFKVKVKDEDKHNSFVIANVIANAAPGFIQNFIEASSVKVLDYAAEGERVSPNIPKNILLGLFVGMIFACILIVVREIFDTRIKNEDELEQWFNIPILGSIPDMSESRNFKNSVTYGSNITDYQLEAKEVSGYVKKSN